MGLHSMALGLQRQEGIPLSGLALLLRLLLCFLSTKHGMDRGKLALREVPKQWVACLMGAMIRLVNG